jgi:hypothetical protein
MLSLILIRMTPQTVSIEFLTLLIYHSDKLPLLVCVYQEFRGAEDGEDNARVKNRQVAKAAAQVLELESAGELCFALTTLRTETRGQ